jgi:dimeric dUTPase (all-alpha-NTP-PPase superfamily)
MIRTIYFLLGKNLNLSDIHIKDSYLRQVLIVDLETILNTELIGMRMICHYEISHA